MQVTRFPARASGPAERVSDFVAHLRMNGLKVGAGETEAGLTALGHVDAADAAQTRLALKAVLASGPEAWGRFDELFDAYWFNAGRQKRGEVKSTHLRTRAVKPALWRQHLEGGESAESGGGDASGGDDDGTDEAEGMDGRLVATRTDSVRHRDLRELMDEESLRAAERAARDLARAIRDRRSRRRKAATRGRRIDMRRVLRSSLARGGAPIDLRWRERPDRPMRIVAICDVSGSMTVYARVFLAFLKGLMSADDKTDAYIFHTRLIRVTSALRDNDNLRAAGRLSLMAEGFGGGTDIAGSLSAFCDSYAEAALNGRTVAIILSDGYCTGEPEALGRALGRIRRRARRIVWLNPLKGWRGYAPVAAGMASALPHLNAHLPANSIEALAALEPEFARL